MKILVVYGTSEGQTAKVAAAMALRFRESGYDVASFDVQRLPVTLNLRDFDAAVIAARVHAGRYPRRIVSFVRANRASLEMMPNAFVSVSMSAAKHVPGDDLRLAKYAKDFAALSGWSPKRTYHVAGARLYTRHNALTRWILGLVDGHRYDTHRDHEWTNWTAVRADADECITAWAVPGATELLDRPTVR